MAAIVLTGTTGCKGFFIPPCQTNCGGGGGGSYSSYAYVANATLGTIEAFPIPTATFTSLTGSSYTLGTVPSAMTATPNGTFLYVAVASSVVAYTIGTNGALTQDTSVSSFLPTAMTVDRSGAWLFVVSTSSQQVVPYQIDSSTGALTAQSAVTLDGYPTQVYFTPNNQYVYIGVGSSGTDVFTFNASTGAMSKVQHLAASGAGSDNTFAADNNSNYLFIGESGTGIRECMIGSGGVLSVVGTAGTTEVGPSAIVVDPTNAYVYVSYKGSNAIVGYTLGSGGALTPFSSSPITTGSLPVAMSLDSTGKYLLVASSGGSPDLEVFSFDATVAGKLDTVVSLATGTDPAGAIALSVVP
ncbi:MAG: lactonase family protein [Acidobacteriaceae bacterium]